MVQRWCGPKQHAVAPKVPALPVLIRPAGHQPAHQVPRQRALETGRLRVRRVRRRRRLLPAPLQRVVTPALGPQRQHRPRGQDQMRQRAARVLVRPVRVHLEVSLLMWAAFWPELGGGVGCGGFAGECLRVGDGAGRHWGGSGVFVRAEVFEVANDHLRMKAVTRYRYAHACGDVCDGITAFRHC